MKTTRNAAAVKGFVVGPEDTLVLIGEVSSSQVAELREQVPERLRGRVLIISGLDGRAVRNGSGA